MTAGLEQKSGESLKVVRLMPEDREGLLQMYREFEPKGAALGLPPRKEPESWLNALSEFPNFVIKAAGRIVGHATLCIEGDAAETAIFVHQNWRSHGIGRLLLCELINEARKLHLRRVWGMAAPDNFVMVRLADSLGFIPGSEPGVFHLDLTENAAVGKPKKSSAA